MDKIWNAALAAASAAAQAENDKLGAEGSRGFDCGFAWITIKPARGPLVAYLKNIGVGHSGSYSGGPGYGIWYGELHSIPTQSVSVHQAAANAATEVLKQHGLNAFWSSRLD